MSTPEPSVDSSCRHGVARQVLGEVYWVLVYLGCYLVGLFRTTAPSTGGTGRPVVLVGGLLGRSTSFFRLRRRLVNAGHPVYTPDFGWQVGNIAKKSRQLESFLHEHELRDFYLVGHSMGGFIVANLDEKVLARAHHIFTLGTGFGGAWTAYVVYFLTGARMMAPHSNFRRRTVERIQGLDNLTLLRAWIDEVALPTSTSSVDGCREVIVSHLGHIQLAMSDCSIDVVTKLIGQLEEATLSEEATPSEPSAREASDLMSTFSAFALPYSAYRTLRRCTLRRCTRRRCTRRR